MPSSKNRLALFELYDKGRTADVDPPSSKEAGGRHGAENASVSAFKETLSSVAQAVGDDERPSRAQERTDSSGSDRRSMIELGNGRIHLALSSRGAGMTLFVGLLLAGVVYVSGQWVGRQSGFADGVADGRRQAQLSLQRTAESEIEKARNSAPVADLFAGIGRSPVSREASPAPVSLAATRVSEPASQPARTDWIKGYTYVVVQTFKGDARQDAVQAQDFLAQHGIETEVFGSTGRGYRLIATKGFNRKDATQKKLADRFVNKIRNIGSAYFEAGGRYKLEGYFATRTADAW